MKAMWIFVSVMVTVNAGYHEEVGIPLATKIKEYEDRIFADIPAMESRIAADDIVSPLTEEYPYVGGLIIQLKSKLISMCGATLVGDTRLVTTAQCLMNVESIEVVLGSQYLFHGGIRIVTTNFTVHPDFGKRAVMDCDVGFVTLRKPADTSGILFPIEITVDYEPENTWGIALGWGVTDNLEDTPKDEYLKLSQARVITFNETSCVSEYKNGRDNKTYDYIVGETVCAAATGDMATRGSGIGSPIIIERYGSKNLVGVVSHTQERELQSILFVATRLRSHTLWLLTK